MSAAHLAQQLTQLSTALFEAGHALDAQPHKTTPDRVARTSLVSWAAPLPADEGFPHDRFATLEEYSFFLRHRQYSVALLDGGLLQVSYRFKRDEVVWHRLAYIPCPVTFTEEDLGGMPLADYLELLNAAELLRRLRLQTAVRFDYDPSNARPNHPASHATLNRTCCRIPVRAPLHLRAFVRFVFSNFYPSIWENEVCVHAIGSSALSACIDAADMGSIHFHWHP